MVPEGTATLFQLPAFRNAYLLRGTLVWVGLRIAAAFGQLSNPGIVGELTMLGLVSLAVFLDARRRSEDLFLGNLGVPGWAIALTALPGAIVLEILVP